LLTLLLLASPWDHSPLIGFAARDRAAASYCLNITLLRTLLSCCCWTRGLRGILGCPLPFTQQRC